jgi:hypothetical protein
MAAAFSYSRCVTMEEGVFARWRATASPHCGKIKGRKSSAAVQRSCLISKCLGIPAGATAIALSDQSQQVFPAEVAIAGQNFGGSHLPWTTLFAAQNGPRDKLRCSTSRRKDAPTVFHQFFKGLELKRRKSRSYKIRKWITTSPFTNATYDQSSVPGTAS